MPVASIDEIRARVGSEVGASPWIEITQADIDAFADVTGDRQFIHVDPDAAAKTPFGGTVAHGFLTLSLLSQMGAAVMYMPDRVKMVVN
ncbi:MAG TPA: MaoC/PaaZ C-terminal domain-containing protein, partial [Allosphingosinicella sp.]|nr:MaoC/PaaZ C-terminal domain-containing protein [Allosphingosinicella sp.]